MKLYYIQVKGDDEDIVFFDKDIKTKEDTFSCLAFFYRKEFAQKYLNYIQEEKSGIEYEIKSVKVNN